MPSLADLFNPTFLMFLGILVLVAALLVVYFESKMRDQNHKIASMLSLVSTLAEDQNGIKMGLNHLAIRTNSIHTGGNLGNTQIINNNNNDLIEVSDDEDEEDEEDEVEVIDDDSNNENNDSEYDYESESNDDSNDNVKVLKLNISKNDSDTEENIDMDETTDLNCDFEPIDEIPEITEEYAEEILSLKYDEPKNESIDLEELKEDNNNLISSDLKTISINLGTNLHNDNNDNDSSQIDYKKLQLPKLRSIVVEKGLTTNAEANKLKKPDLLKLLGVE